MAGTGDNMKNDHQYAEVLEMMRSQGAKDNPTLAQIGVMQSSNSVKIDDLELNAEDLYIADYLVAGYTRQIKVPYVSGVSVILHRVTVLLVRITQIQILGHGNKAR